MRETDPAQTGANGAGNGPEAETLRQLAYRDPLTGLLNRRGFDEELRKIWTLGQQHALPIGLLIIDIDNFKSVNDSYGHPVGDQVLIECARTIQASVREADIVCRYYGGDEMVVILPGSTAEETRRVAERMLEQVRTRIICPGTHDLRASVSIGVCSMTARPGQTAERFFLQADRALYRAKQTGRNRACFAEDLAGGPPEAAPAPPPPDRPVGVAEGRGTVLVVDDDHQLCTLFQRLLTREKFAVLVAETGAAALAAVQKERGLIDVALVDLHLGGESGFELLKQLRLIDESMIGVIITGQATLDSAVTSLRYGAYDFVQKPVAAPQLTAVLERATKYRRLVLENKRYQVHLEDMVREKSAALTRALEQVRTSYQFTLEAMASMLDIRERKTGEHSKRVALLAGILAREMGLGPEELETIRTGALLHDIGKIGIPDAILLKPAALDPAEREIMNTHPQLGYDIIRSSPVLAGAAEIVRAHQEHYDGRGYPRGLRGEEICIGARIFAVVDAYDAIRADRPYSKGRSAAEALAEILRHSGTQFDPAVVETLRRCQPEIETGGRWPA